MTGRGALEIRLLGRFAVVRDGVEVPTAEFGGRKVRTLLRVLATRRGSFVSNDVLTVTVWPDRPPADPAANLQVLVNRARKALGNPDVVRTGVNGYALADEGVRIDAEDFLAAVERPHDEPPGAELRALTEALTRWTGDPLAEDAYADWAEGYRTRILRARQDATERAAELALDTGDFPAAIAHASAAHESEPLRERAVLTLIRALAAAGDPAAALVQYDEYRRTLADELGVDPSPDAQEVYQRLLDGVPRKDSARTPRHVTAFADLPFVGRERELAHVESALAEARGATVLISGACGAGKSRFLDVLARRVPTVAARAVLPERAEPWSLVRSLLREVIAQDALRIDELSPPLRAALGELLPEVEGDGSATDGESRRALVHEAALRLLAGLPGAVGGAVGGAASGVVAVLDHMQWADPSSLALIETARARIPSLQLVIAYRADEIADAPDVGAVLDRLAPDVRVELDGLSRADIESLVTDPDLAAALAEHTDATPLAVTEVLRALAADGAINRDDDGRWLPRDADTVVAAAELGRRGQRRTLAARADRLSPDAREALGLLCLLAREAPVSTLSRALETSERDTLAALTVLHRAGLVRPGDVGWGTAHDMVSDAIAERMEQATRARLHGRLADALDADGDLVGAARHAHAAGDRARAGPAFARAARSALNAHADTEAEQLAQHGLDIAPSAEVTADLYEIRGEARARLGSIDVARSDLRAALAVQTNPSGRSRLFARLAMLASGADDMLRATELAELALVEAGEDERAQAQALEVASVLDMNVGRTQRSAERSAAALALYQRLGDGSGTARIIDARAMATFLDGRVADGAIALRRAADLFEDAGDLLRVVTPRSTSGHALVFAGQADDGLVATTTALDIARALGHPEGQAYALWHRAESLVALGRAEEAEEDAKDALAIATRLGHRGWTATSWRAMGIAAQARGDLEAALHAYSASLEVSDHLDLFACWAASRAAMVLLAIGDVEAATPLVERALTLGPPLGQFEARLAQAELAAARGDGRTAALARAAIRAADAAGVAQGRARLAQLARLPTDAT